MQIATKASLPPLSTLHSSPRSTCHSHPRRLAPGLLSLPATTTSDPRILVRKIRHILRFFRSPVMLFQYKIRCVSSRPCLEPPVWILAKKKKKNCLFLNVSIQFYSTLVFSFQPPVVLGGFILSPLAFEKKKEIFWGKCVTWASKRHQSLWLLGG